MAFHFRNSLRIFGLVACLSGVCGGLAQAQTTPGAVLEVPLFPGFDNFGNQFQVIQTWDDGSGERMSFSIYDTGASVITLSANEQQTFEALGDMGPGPVPIKKVGGASATAIGGSGTLTGDVSTPGFLRAAGMSAFSFDINDPNFGGVNPTAGVQVPGIQLFVGTTSSSSNLPTITGTPIHIPSGVPGTVNEFGAAAKISMQGYTFDLGEFFPGDPLFQGVSFSMPEAAFIAPNTSLIAQSYTYDAVHIPVTLYGEDNTASPGDLPSASFNPVVESVKVSRGAASAANKAMLFDTGAQLSIISEEMALSLGLNLDAPETSITVQGASGTVAVPGFTIDLLEVPRSDGGVIQFQEVPIYVLDIGEGLDGILGMNLFNGAHEMLYDPHAIGGPQVSVTFLNNRTLENEENLLEFFESMMEDLPGVDLLLSEYGSRFGVAGTVVIPSLNIVPEPSSAMLLVLGAAGFLARRRSRRRV